MKEKIKNICVIGLGKQGSLHLEAANQLKKMGLIDNVFGYDVNFEVLNKLDVDHHKLPDLKYKFNTPVLFVICAPNNFHKEIISQIQKNNPLATILKEKPIGNEDLNESINVAQQRFFNETYIFAKRHLDLIGDIKYFDYQYTLNDNRESWYWDKKSGGGCFMNVGWHFLFVTNWFFGNPDSIDVRKIATKRRKFNYDTDDTNFIDIKYKTFFGKVYLSVAETAKKDILRIVGTRGTIEVNKKSCKIIDINGELLKEKEGDEMVAYMKQLWTMCEGRQYVLSQLRIINQWTEKTVNSY